MESEIDEVADRLLRCPVGRNVLLTIERDRTPLALAVTPPPSVRASRRRSALAQPMVHKIRRRSYSHRAGAVRLGSARA